ncbi:ornithine cyclodeaminase family protein [Lacibacterium aquatile]|uniref:Ornithine cyclodeaminase family protein n=1 Tax=Lacibacterium aquatile TaxID=1168082 RepID=A0ABW5DNG6_9PROT
MKMIDAATLRRQLTYPALIDALDAAFCADVTVPVRHHHTVPVPGGSDATLLLMPAWTSGRHIGVKMVNVFPDNGARSLPSVMGVYLLFSGETGAPLALMDGPMLTVRRTAAASALASRYLSRPDAATLAMVGTGALAPHLIEAHAAVRPLKKIILVGRSEDKACALRDSLPKMPGVSFEVTTDGEAAVAAADIVSCATLSRDPVVKGDWLKPGAHLDLVGGFTPEMRETDDAAIRRASVFCDTRAGATKEAGDLVQPLASGVLTQEAIRGDLFDLARKKVGGRRSADEITLFKSVGTALEDLAAAELAVQVSR